MKFKISIVFLLPLFAFTCVSKKNFVTVENKTEKNIYCIPRYNYPDSSLSFITKDQILANDAFFYLRPMSSKKLFYTDLCKRETWSRLIKTDTLQVFVFEEDVIKQKSWEDITADKLYLRRLTYAYDDIVNNGCKITIQ